MESLEIAREYYNGVEELIGDIIMVLYGSTVFGVKTSDLDLCFFREEMLPIDEFNKLKKFTHEFHINNNLRIDEEIPYDNKLIYTYDFIESSLINSPFPFCDGKYIIPKIEKNKIFLNSLEMKKRLLLNILTVKHIVMGREKEKVANYTDRAWESILKTVISYSEEKNISFEKILNCLYKDPFNQSVGEMYLGYKTNMPEKMNFIKEQVMFQLERLVSEDKILKTLSKGYIPNKRWLNNE